MATEEDRPAKRIKIAHQSIPENSDVERVGNPKDTQISKDPKFTKQDGHSRKFTGQVARRDRGGSSNHSAVVKTFSQPTAISAGDKGIFVTCDKGREKKCLLELQDLFQQYLDEQSIDTMGHALPSLGSSDQPSQSQKSTSQDDLQEGIEADIAAELNYMRSADSSDQGASKSTKQTQLITLDIPCVSFLRLPTGSTIDTVLAVHTICDQAKTAPSQRSRYIQRLTPITRLEKVLSDGLDKVCDSVLPLHFARSNGTEIENFKFAIRPTVRNNDKIGRDQIIQTVASKIQKCGRDKHKVDLKHYEKGVLVEVYRGWVGISVVNNVATDVCRHGYEALKRFNLAEIYTSKEKRAK